MKICVDGLPIELYCMYINESNDLKEAFKETLLKNDVDYLPESEVNEFFRKANSAALFQYDQLYNETNEVKEVMKEAIDSHCYHNLDTIFMIPSKMRIMDRIVLCTFGVLPKDTRYYISLTRTTLPNLKIFIEWYYKKNTGQEIDYSIGY